MARQQLPPGIKKLTLADGTIRYEVVADAGLDPITGKRRQTRKRYRTEKAARDKLAEVGVAVARGTYVARSKLTLEQACADWLAGKHDIRATTLKGYEQALKPIRSELGHLPVQQLAKRDLDDLVKALQAGTITKAGDRARKPWSARTINYTLGTISQVLADLVAQGELARNVGALISRLPQQRPEMKTYTAVEVNKLLKAATGDRNGHAWHLALSGLRRGEICGLEWSQIDWSAKTVTVSKNRVSVAGQAMESAPKTRRSTRTLPLTPGLHAALKAARARQNAERLALGEAYGAGTHVVCDEAGRVYHPETISDYWTKITKAAGVRSIRLHDARHTCGTLMHLEGVPIAVISAWLGHADASFTMRTYMHSQDDALKAAAASLGAVVTNRDIG